MKIILHILLAYFITQSIYSQDSFRFEWELYDGISPTEGMVDNEGNILIVGFIDKIDQNLDGDGFIFKMTLEGDYQYYRYVGGVDSTVIFDNIIQLENGNYFVSGSKGGNMYNDAHEHEMILIFNQDLELLSEKEFMLPVLYKRMYDANLLIEESGNILMSATAIQDSTIGTVNDLALFRFNQEGDSLESVFLHYSHNCEVFDMDKIPNSSNYLILEANTSGAGFFECYILNPDLTMDTVSHYGGDCYVDRDIITDYWYPDNSFMMASGLTFSGNSDDGLGVFRCDTMANISDYLYLNKVGIYDRHAFRQCMSFADENSIYIAGFMADYWDCSSNDSIELYVVDTALNQIAYKSLGGDMSYDAMGVLTAKNKDAIIYGKAYYQEEEVCNHNLVIYYVSRSELGLPPVAVFDTKNTLANTSVYPNPSNGFIHIQVNKDLLKDNSRIKIFNPNGQKVYDYRLPNKGNTLQLDITNLEEGVYVYHITNGESIISTGKFIKN